MAIPCEYGLFHIPNESKVYDFLTSFSSHYKPVHSYLSSTICAIGVLSNICNIVVLTRKSMRTPVNVILCSIALFDVIVMVINLIVIFHFSLLMSECDVSVFTYGWVMFLALYAQVSVIGHSASVWLSVTMAFFRYMVIRIGSNNTSMCQGFRVTMLHAYGSIICVTCFVFICNLPNTVSYSITEHNASDFFGFCSNFTNEVVYFVDKNNVGRADECFLLRLAFWLNGLVLKMVPCILLTFFMTVLLRVLAEVKMRRIRLRAAACAAGNNSTTSGVSSASKESHLLSLPGHRSPSSSVSIQQTSRRCSALAHQGDPAADRTTRMLIAIICVFLATELPQGIMAVATGLYSMEFHTKIYKPLGDMFDILSLINSCATFVIYCSMSRQYRIEFRQLFFPKQNGCWNWKLEIGNSYGPSRASTIMNNPREANDDISLNLIINQHKRVPEIVIEPATVTHNPASLSVPENYETADVTFEDIGDDVESCSVTL